MLNEQLELEMPWRDEIGQTRHRLAHGGVLASLIDLTGPHLLSQGTGQGAPI